MADMIDELQKAMGRLWTENRLGAERIIIGRDGMLAWRETELEMARLQKRLDGENPWRGALDYTRSPSTTISAVFNPYDGGFVPIVVNPDMIEAPWVMESRPCA